ncbi:hypothetical protein BVI2075_150072 [Burkholderia vietnamiensis]|nr:hypothetical protein BVI2075_150072 [Burkholderia vietnamiensis]
MDHFYGSLQRKTTNDNVGGSATADRITEAGQGAVVRIPAILSHFFQPSSTRSCLPMCRPQSAKRRSFIKASRR